MWKNADRVSDSDNKLAALTNKFGFNLSRTKTVSTNCFILDESGHGFEWMTCGCFRPASVYLSEASAEIDYNEAVYTHSSQRLAVQGDKH